MSHLPFSPLNGHQDSGASLLSRQRLSGILDSVDEILVHVTLMNRREIMQATHAIISDVDIDTVGIAADRLWTCCYPKPVFLEIWLRGPSMSLSRRLDPMTCASVVDFNSIKSAFDNPYTGNQPPDCSSYWLWHSSCLASHSALLLPASPECFQGRQDRLESGPRVAVMRSIVSRCLRASRGQVYDRHAYEDLLVRRPWKSRELASRGVAPRRRLGA